MPVGPQHGSFGGSSSGGSNGGYRGGSRSWGGSRGSGNRNIFIFGGGFGGGSSENDETMKQNKNPVIRAANEKKEKYGLFITLISLLLLFMIGFCIGNVFSFNKNRDAVQIMENDMPFYTALAQNGEEHEADIVFVKEYCKLDGVVYYYVTYQVMDATGIKYSGETYAQYTQAEINAKGGRTGKIEIRVDDDGYSINSDYVAQNAEYRYLVKMRDSAKTKATIFGVVAGVSLVLLVLLIIKSREVYQEQNIIIKNELKHEEKKAAIAAKGPTCPYCGTALKENSDKCPSCGATKR